MDQNHAKMISSFEQAGAHLGVFATLLFSYHKSLCESGFLRDEALVLVQNLQAMIFAQAFNFGPKSEEE